MLRRLSEAMGVSGSEKEIRRILRELAAPYGETWTDAMGNLYVHKAGEGKKVMVCAHMDEVGMLVKGILDDGLLAYTSAGIDSRVCVSKRVLVGAGKIPGVIGAKAIHLQKREDLQKAIPHDELFVDIGAESREDAMKYVKVGDPICFDTQFSYFGDGMMKGKALDDRLGCAVVLELLKWDYDCDFYAVFTVQEEVGARGAEAAAYRVQPDLALILEGTTANDMPEAESHQQVTEVGKGPAISMMDNGTIVNPQLFRAMKQMAEQQNIPHQVRRGTNGRTDAGVIHKACAGALAIGLSVPCRYIHGPVSVASMADFENTVKLADAFLQARKYEEVKKNV